MIRNGLLIIIAFVSCLSFAQIKDIGGVDYTFISNSDSDADFSRTRLWINFPIELKKEGHILVTGIRYANIHLDFNQTYDFELDPLRTIHSIEYTLGYTFLLKNKDWRFTAQLAPTISSNLDARIQFDDLIWSGGVLFVRTREEPTKSRLTLGLFYSQQAGIPAPIPFATYFKQVNEKLNYTIGVPISKMKYFPNKKTSFEGFITFDGYYANLSNTLDVNGRSADHISLSAIVTGLGFDKYYGKRMNVFVKGGYTLRNALRLMENPRDEVFEFNMKKSITFRVGLKFNF